MIRVVVDTNVLVSAFISPRGAPARMFEKLHQGMFAILVSEAILREYIRALSYDRVVARHGMTAGQIHRTVDSLKQFFILVEITEHLTVIAGDPDDDKFLECAVAGEAEYLVSGDAHLLERSEYRGIRIMTPALFQALLDTLER